MPSPVSRCVLSSGLTLALVLSAPLAASAADGGGGRGERGPSSTGEERRGGPTPTPSATTRPATDAERAGSSGSARREDSPRSTRAPERKRPEKGPARRPAADPRGNNGTVKVDGLPYDDGRGNEPHVGCEFRLVFWGFDAGDTASIVFTGHAPTGGGVLHRETGTLISDDAAGGGQDRDAALVYRVSDQLSELLSVAPHPQQGWHVKVAVDVDGAPGGAKQKVFWIDCPPAAPVQGTTTQDTPVEQPAGTGTGAGGGETTTTTRTVVPPAGELTLGSGGTEVLSGTETAAAVATVAGGGGIGRAAVSAQDAVRPSALPFTGAGAVGLLTAIGLGSLAAGGVAHRLGRRREQLAL